MQRRPNTSHSVLVRTQATNRSKMHALRTKCRIRATNRFEMYDDRLRRVLKTAASHPKTRKNAVRSRVFEKSARIILRNTYISKRNVAVRPLLDERASFLTSDPQRASSPLDEVPPPDELALSMSELPLSGQAPVPSGRQALFRVPSWQSDSS